MSNPEASQGDIELRVGDGQCSSVVVWEKLSFGKNILQILSLLQGITVYDLISLLAGAFGNKLGSL